MDGRGGEAEAPYSSSATWLGWTGTAAAPLALVWLLLTAGRGIDPDGIAPGVSVLAEALLFIFLAPLYLAWTVLAALAVVFYMAARSWLPMLFIGGFPLVLLVVSGEFSAVLAAPFVILVAAGVVALRAE